MPSKANHSERPRLLAIFAHPDDESFLAGGTLAKYTSLGWDVFLACATNGEGGRRGEYEALDIKQFADLRRSEVQAACEALGVHTPTFLECPDGAVANKCLESAIKQIATIMRQLTPDVVLTFGPDGVSGHPDHKAISLIVSNAFATAFLNDTSNHEKQPPVASLYYVLRSDAVPQCCKPSGPAIEPPLLTTTIEIASVGQQKLAAMHSHRSQKHLLPTDEASIIAILNAPEHFHRAYPKWTGPAPETKFICLNR